MRFYEMGLFESELKEIINALRGKERFTDAGQSNEYTQQQRDRLADRLEKELWTPYPSANCPSEEQMNWRILHCDGFEPYFTPFGGWLQSIKNLALLRRNA